MGINNELEKQLEIEYVEYIKVNKTNICKTEDIKFYSRSLYLQLEKFFRKVDSEKLLEYSRLENIEEILKHFKDHIGNMSDKNKSEKILEILTGHEEQQDLKHMIASKIFSIKLTNDCFVSEIVRGRINDIQLTRIYSNVVYTTYNRVGKRTKQLPESERENVEIMDKLVFDSMQRAITDQGLKFKLVLEEPEETEGNKLE